MSMVTGPVNHALHWHCFGSGFARNGFSTPRSSALAGLMSGQDDRAAWTQREP